MVPESGVSRPVYYPHLHSGGDVGNRQGRTHVVTKVTRIVTVKFNVRYEDSYNG